MVCVTRPFLREEHVCEESVVGEVEEGEKELREVCQKDGYEEAAASREEDVFGEEGLRGYGSVAEVPDCFEGFVGELVV